jgi:hypothetical protein
VGTVPIDGKTLHDRAIEAFNGEKRLGVQQVEPSDDMNPLSGEKLASKPVLDEKSPMKLYVEKASKYAHCLRELLLVNPLLKEESEMTSWELADFQAIQQRWGNVL